MLRFGIFLILWLVASAYSFHAAASDIRRETSTNISDDCFKITSVRLDENGLVTLKFEQNYYHSARCPENTLYDVKTVPKGQIRGAKGVVGRTPEKVFYIQVTPDTERISLQILKSGRASLEYFKVSYVISSIKSLIEAEKSMPSWQKCISRGLGGNSPVEHLS